MMQGPPPGYAPRPGYGPPPPGYRPPSYPPPGPRPEGGVHARATAVLDSHPGFRDGEVFEEETIAGHVFYLIPEALDAQGVQWQSGGDVLTWLR